MPTLLEMQGALRKSVVLGERAAAAGMLAPGVSPDRLDIYRNTFLMTTTKALRLCFPAVQRLVGDEFFEAAAHFFIAEQPPRTAWLDEYGAEFPDFLRAFPPAGSLRYLADVGRLEWAVSRALHAADTRPLDPARIAAVEAEELWRVRLITEPSLTLLDFDYPADTIWRAVLADDDRGLGAVDLASGKVRVLVARSATGVEVERLSADQWRFLAKLVAGESIGASIDPEGDFDPSTELAGHFLRGRFTDFELVPSPAEEAT